MQRKGTGAIHLGVAALVACSMLAAARPGWGQAEGRAEVAAGVQRVTIHRDPWGVPHIYAATEEAGYYGLGYAQAEDQLETLLAFFLLARGELAAAFGADANPEECALLASLGICNRLVEMDLLQRQWLHAEEARAGFERLSPQLQRNYRAYVAGVRRFIRERPEEVPAWAPEPQPWDPVGVSRAILWLAYHVRDGLLDCGRGGVSLTAAVGRALDAGGRHASNEWILAPWRTADGAMIVLSDPHGGVDGSFVHEYRMEAGELKTAGYAMAALPILVHNRFVSWGMTTGAPDVSDCYEVRVDRADSLRYRYGDEWRRMEVRDVSIAVAGGEPVLRRFAYTRHNGVLSPVIAWQDGKAYVVSTPYMDQGGVFDEEVYRMSRARSVAEVRAAMQSLGMFPQNVMVGDAHGDSWYVRAGRTPRRPAGHDWTRPVPGNSPEAAWLGIHPLEDLVQLENPAAGYMQNNNIAPDRMLEDSPLTADRYPAYIFNDRPGRTNTRASRTVEVLARAYHFTVDDAIELALDEKWPGTEAWQRALARALDADRERVRQAPPRFRRFVDRILRFDGHARAESAGALAYAYWREALWSAPAGESVDTLGTMREDGAQSPELARRLLDGVDRAIELMVRRHGRTDVRYGDVHRIGRGGFSWPLGGGAILPANLELCSVPSRWDRDCVVTLRAFTFGPPDSLGHRYAVSGSRMLRLVVFTDPIQSFTLHNFGQSNRPGSPHYADQAQLSSRRRLKPTYFEQSELLPHIVSTRTLDVPAS